MHLPHFLHLARPSVLSSTFLDLGLGLGQGQASYSFFVRGSKSSPGMHARNEVEQIIKLRSRPHAPPAPPPVSRRSYNMLYEDPNSSSRPCRALSPSHHRPPPPPPPPPRRPPGAPAQPPSSPAGNPRAVQEKGKERAEYLRRGVADSTSFLPPAIGA